MEDKTNCRLQSALSIFLGLWGVIFAALTLLLLSYCVIDLSRQRDSMFGLAIFLLLICAALTVVLIRQSFATWRRDVTEDSVRAGGRLLGITVVVISIYASDLTWKSAPSFQNWVHSQIHWPIVLFVLAFSVYVKSALYLAHRFQLKELTTRSLVHPLFSIGLAFWFSVVLGHMVAARLEGSLSGKWSYPAMLLMVCFGVGLFCLLERTIKRDAASSLEGGEK